MASCSVHCGWHLTEAVRSWGGTSIGPTSNNISSILNPWCAHSLLQMSAALGCMQHVKGMRSSGCAASMAADLRLQRQPCVRWGCSCSCVPQVLRRGACLQERDKAPGRCAVCCLAPAVLPAAMLGPACCHAEPRL